MIGLKSTSENNSKKLLLTTQCKNTSALFFGKVIFDFAINAGKENLHFDEYSIQTSSNQEIVSINDSELKIILKKKKLFDEVVDDAQRKNFKMTYKLLRDEIKAETNYEQFVSAIEPNLKINYVEFDGFVLNSENGEEYITFSRSNGKKRIIVSFFLDSSDTIVGYSLEGI